MRSWSDRPGGGTVDEEEGGTPQPEGVAADTGGSFMVVVNDCGQYSVWSSARIPPAGWHDAGHPGSRQDCLDHVATMWTDLNSVGRGRPDTAGPVSRRTGTGGRPKETASS